MSTDQGRVRIRAAEHLESAGFPTDLTMVIKGQKGVISLLFSDSQKKEEWEEAILNAIEIKLNKQQETAQEVLDVSDGAFESAPQWVNDDATSSCMICDVRFKSLVKRRHHCRGCGLIYRRIDSN
ncbi:hypothetical protein LSH36_21g11014 [Paralvinella palmiformis]|uniref:FYVE zinc finger domain-containing protein n=1 Tax=Paralvinella palmiformis TaxID=53620 RepID=A0AAD9NH41_9ANNE|nr:hypothetical protein LSH36_21g11014 [Paralvinella palmiformis]